MRVHCDFDSFVTIHMDDSCQMEGEKVKQYPEKNHILSLSDKNLITVILYSDTTLFHLLKVSGERKFQIYFKLCDYKLYSN